MQFTEIPERLLSSRTAVRVLRVLLSRPQREMTGREIAAIAKAPHPRVIERLRQFEGEGLVTWRVVGRAHLWRLENSHVLVPALALFFEVDSNARAELRRTLRKGLTPIPGVLEARLFGSVVRGDERPDSDVDVLLVVKDRASKTAARSALEGMSDEVRQRFGNRLNAILLTEGELSRRPNRAFLAPARLEGELLSLVVNRRPPSRRAS